MNLNHDDSGNVVIEFIATAVALLIPISYLAMATLQIATGYIDVQNAARAGARIYSTSSSDAQGKDQSIKAVQAALNYPTQVQVLFECSANPCLAAENIVTVRVNKWIPIELPAFLGNHSIQVHGIQSEIVQDAQ
jgi:Flp pilus assembly protein TadG